MAQKRKPNGKAKCNANTEHGPCQLSAGWGTNHLGYGPCRKHLGNAPKHVTHAHELAARDACQKFGVPVKCTAEQALLDELWASKGQVLFYRERVAELERADMIYGYTNIRRTRDRDSSGAIVVHEEQVQLTTANQWIKLLKEAERHHFQVAATIAQLGIEQRLVDIAQANAILLHKIIATSVARLGIPVDDPRIPQVIPEVIRELTQ